MFKLLNVGDKVFGYNDTKFGAHAEFMTIAETDAITTIPNDVTFEEAAPITEGAHYALCDIRAAKIKMDNDVMIYGALWCYWIIRCAISKIFWRKSDRGM